MSLSANIKRLRLEKNLTQEQLATKLGVSAQAVSKWETSETYPDGALLVPLANELEVSLDELFGNETVTMADISGRIVKLIHNTEAKERFNVARDIGWQIERGLFNCRMEIGKRYDPNEIKNQKNASYILDDNGFTIVSNGKEPFFSVFPQPEEGYGHFLNDKDDLQKIFASLSHTDTILRGMHPDPFRSFGSTGKAFGHRPEYQGAPPSEREAPHAGSWSFRYNRRSGRKASKWCGRFPQYGRVRR